jgi:predicted RNA binding protein YcfA (HicA-like mRNA interferase family)
MEATPMCTALKRHHRRGTCSWRQLLRALERSHFVFARGHGSHLIYVHEPTGHAVAVLCGGRDVANGTLAKLVRSVRRITGIDLDI